MGISHQLGAMFGQFRAEITAVEAGEPELVRLYCRIGTADHFKFQIGNNALERYWRMIEEKLVTLSAGLFTAKKCEHHGALRGLTLGQGRCELQHSHAARRIIVSAVIDAVTIDRLAYAEVVQVSCKKYDFIF